jgi:amino acid transporter
VYLVVAVVSVALVPVGTLKSSETPLVDVVQAGAPGVPIKDLVPYISMVAVSNTALINMLMASRLIYGMARQNVLPPVLGVVSPVRRTPWVAILGTTAIAFGVILYVTAFANSNAIAVLGGTTSLLLLGVFAMVNVAVLVLRRDTEATRRRHFSTPTLLPVIGCLTSLYLVTPLSGRPGQQYLLATILVVSGAALSAVTLRVMRPRTGRGAGSSQPDPAADSPGEVVGGL